MKHWNAAGRNGWKPGKTENKAQLTAIAYLSRGGRKIGFKELEKWIKKGNGTAELTTIAGGKLWVMKKDGKWWIKDEMGGVAARSPYKCLSKQRGDALPVDRNIGSQNNYDPVRIQKTVIISPIT